MSCKFSIQNIGQVAGVETAQCYIGFKSDDNSEPKKTLQGFSKIALDPNIKSKVQIDLSPRSFSSWNIESKTWEVRPGSYDILIGSSAENIILQTTITL